MKIEDIDFNKYIEFIEFIYEKQAKYILDNAIVV